MQSLMGYYFFIDMPIADLKLETENVVPFPRITFRYFFDNPFSVTTRPTEDTIKAEMIISRISTNQI